METYEKISNYINKYATDNNLTVMAISIVGSTMWNLDNEESDYDVVFVFKYNDLFTYIDLSQSESSYKLEVKKNEIEGIKRKLEIMGFDIRAFIKQIVKSTPTVFEFMNGITDMKKYSETEPLHELISKMPLDLLIATYYAMLSKNIRLIHKDDNYGNIKLILNILREIYILGNLTNNKQKFNLNIKSLVEWFSERDYIDGIIIEKVVAERNEGKTTTKVMDHVDKLITKDLHLFTKYLQDKEKGMSKKNDILTSIRSKHENTIYEHSSKFLRKCLLKN
jgi:predicted nucleotidyltransferase